LSACYLRCTELLGCDAGSICSVDEAVSDLPYSHGDDVALMINGLGGTPVSELFLLYGYAHERLTKRGINVRRNYVGNYCTSPDMAGCSITLTRLDDEIHRPARRPGRDWHPHLLTPLRRGGAPCGGGRPAGVRLTGCA
jgi:hypothetical protein